jgi:hypothetical protein
LVVSVWRLMKPYVCCCVAFGLCVVSLSVFWPVLPFAPGPCGWELHLFLMVYDRLLNCFRSGFR